MKLVYIFLGGSRKSSSVQHKIVCQIREMRKNGIDAHGWFFSPSEKSAVELEENITIFPLQPHPRPRKWFQSYFDNQEYYRQISEKLEKDGADFTTVYIRHGNSGTEYFNLLLKNKERVYVYIPSNSISENYLEKKVAPKNSLVSTILGWIEYYQYFYRKEVYLIKNVLPKIKGTIVFTPEFGRMLNQRASGQINIIYNRDGADCKKSEPRKQVIHNDQTLRLIFMKGSALLQPWAGLDRLIKSIQACPELNIILYITGNVLDPERYHFPFIKITGMIPNEDLNDLVNEVDLGVSNLANYMIGFNETTNLKSREYFARGLPFIQANSMPDIEGTAAAGYYMQLPNNDSLIDMNRVFEFAKKMRADANHPLEMNHFSKENLDWSVTVAELSSELKK